MARNYFGENERLLLSLIKEMDVDGTGVKRRTIVDMACINTGKNRETLYKSLRNMSEKSLIILNPITDKVRIPDRWLALLKAGKCSLDIQPQQLLSFNKRIEILYMSMKNIKLTEVQVVALFALLDLNKEAIQALMFMIKGEPEEKINKDFDELVNLYMGRTKR